MDTNSDVDSDSEKNFVESFWLTHVLKNVPDMVLRVIVLALAILAGIGIGLLFVSMYHGNFEIFDGVAISVLALIFTFTVTFVLGIFGDMSMFGDVLVCALIFILLGSFFGGGIMQVYLNSLGA